MSLGNDTTEFTGLTIDGVEITATPAEINAGANMFEETIAFGDMTDVTTTGTYVITTGSMAIGDTLTRVVATAVTGFAGDTSAVITIGDGSDTDRYMTGTPDVFSDLLDGLDLGIPSGVGYHAAAKSITVTVTTNADFSNVSAGSLTLKFYYLA